VQKQNEKKATATIHQQNQEKENGGHEKLIHLNHATIGESKNARQRKVCHSHQRYLDHQPQDFQKQRHAMLHNH
jgi:hypothetical protein